MTPTSDKRHESERLTAGERARLECDLSRWQTPIELEDACDESRIGIGPETFFTQPGLAFLRDAWVAARFAKRTGADQVRIVPGDWPDFETRVGDRMESYEVVEADAPDRRRGDEYKAYTPTIEYDPVEDWIARAEAAPKWIERACLKKAAKSYAGKAGLVIYLNMSEYGIRRAEIEASFHAATQAARGVFESVWIVWDGRVYHVWQGGEHPERFTYTA